MINIREVAVCGLARKHAEPKTSTILPNIYSSFSQKCLSSPEGAIYFSEKDKTLKHKRVCHRGVGVASLFLITVLDGNKQSLSRAGQRILKVLEQTRVTCLLGTTCRLATIFG